MIDQTSELREVRKFGMVTSSVVVVVFGLIPLYLGNAIHSWPWFAALFLLSSCLIFPHHMRWLYRLWMVLGALLGAVNGRIVMALAYFLMIVPIGVLVKLLSRDLLQTRFDREASTYRVAMTARPSKHMERPF